MKVLILGNSNDTGTFVPEDVKRGAYLRDRLAGEFGEPVELVTKNTWPNDGMVSYVARFVDELQPDFVFVNVTNYPFAYESLPLRMKRVFGRLGAPAGDAGMRLADSRRWSHNAVFRFIRKWGQASIGGDTHFTPEEVTERYTALIRMLLRHEGTVVAVKGPLARASQGVTKRERARKEAKRQSVHQSLKEFCRHHHVFYAGSDEPYYVVHPQAKGTTVGDGLHANASGHASLADDHYVHLSAAWRQHLELQDQPLPPPAAAATR